MQKFHGMTMTDTHVYFWRNHTPFSNFYRKPFMYKGHKLLFSEQAFMIEKALQFDPSKVDLIASVRHPQDAKSIGREIRNYNDRIWSAKRYHAMVRQFPCRIIARCLIRVTIGNIMGSNPIHFIGLIQKGCLTALSPQQR